MNLLTLFIALVVGFLIIGFIAAVIDHHRDSECDENDEYESNIVISQQVPSVFDTFKGGKQ